MLDTSLVADSLGKLRGSYSRLPQQDLKFAESLLSQADRNGSLSEKQAYWVVELAKRVDRAPRNIDVSNILALFARVEGKLKNPKIVLRHGELGIMLRVAGERSRNRGDIQVFSNAPYAQREYYGRIVKADGKWLQTAICPKTLIETLEAFALDPAGVASVYGHTTGNCCFCCRELTDSRSVHVGYGPICAERYGLPWGDITEGEEGAAQ